LGERLSFTHQRQSQDYSWDAILGCQAASQLQLAG